MSEKNGAVSTDLMTEVGVVGATGLVGRRLVRLLARHPWFRVREVAASPASAGRAYGEAWEGGQGESLPEEILALTLKDPEASWSSPLVLSALPSGPARSLEPRLAREGHLVVSNASAHRMEPDVPLVIPEVNPEHLGLLDRQREGSPGGIVTNPNCSVIGLMLPLAALHRTFGLGSVMVSTLQAISGAGKSGPRALDLVDNVIPHIPGEEEKLESEPGKILGELEEEGIREAGFPVSAGVHRVPVLDGHLLAVSVSLESPGTHEEVVEALEAFRGPDPISSLPHAPASPIRVVWEEDRPQPRLDRDRGEGMVVTVGRVRPCRVLDVRFSVLSHNLVRGAAGAALLNAELCVRQGRVPGQEAISRTDGGTSRAGGGAPASGVREEAR